MKELTKTEQAIYQRIPLGKNRAISQEMLANVSGLSRREVTRQVQNMRLKGCLIGSSRSIPNGYYRIETTEEYYQVIGMLMSGYKTLGATINAMSATYNSRTDITGQLELLDPLEVM